MFRIVQRFLPLLCTSLPDCDYVHDTRLSVHSHLHCTPQQTELSPSHGPCQAVRGYLYLLLNTDLNLVPLQFAHGFVAEGYEAVKELFEKNLKSGRVSAGLLYWSVKDCLLRMRTPSSACMLRGSWWWTSGARGTASRGTVSSTSSAAARALQP